MRIKPKNPDYELAVLATLLQYECNANVEEYIYRLTPSMFTNMMYLTVFKCMKSVFDKNKTCDMIMLITYLKDNNIIFDMDVIVNLSDSAVSPSNLNVYIEELESLSQKREIIEMFELGLENIYSNEVKDVKEFVFDVSEKMQQIVSRGSKEVVTIDKLIIDVMGKMSERQQNAEEDGVKTYIDAMDRQLGKLQDGNLIVVASRPAMGKTAFVCSIVANWLMRGGNLHFFTFEMSDTELAERIVSNGTDIDYNKIKGRMSIKESDFDKVGNYSIKIDGEVVVDGVDFIELNAFKARCMEIKKSHNTDMIIVDYLQLMKSNQHKNREQEISAISRGMKEIAMKLQIPIIALCQLSRKVEERTDKIPMMSDLRESGAIEQDADKVLFLMRPEYYGITELEDGSTTKDVGFGYVRKNRNGTTGDVKLKFEGDKQRYSDYNNYDKYEAYESSEKRISSQHRNDSDFND